MLTVKRILKEIGNPNLKLYRGDGYFYFEYDDLGTFADRCVMVCRVGQLSLESWVYEGMQLIESINKEQG